MKNPSRFLGALTASRRPLGAGPRGFVTGATAAIVVVVSLAVVSGTGNASSVVNLLDGGAWLASFSTGSVSHVNGPSGRVDAAVSFTGAAGSELEVVQDSSEIFVVNHSTGEVGHIDPAILDVTQRVDFGDGPELDVVAGENVAYVIDQEGGIVQQVDPKTLAKRGRAVSLPPPLSRGVIDDDGTLWVATSKGTLVPMIGGKAGDAFSAGAQGDALDVVLVDGQPVLLNRTKGTASAVGSGGVAKPLALPKGHLEDLRVARRNTGVLALVSAKTGTLVTIDLRGRQVETFNLGRAGHDLGPPARNGDRIYVADSEGSDLVVVDLKSKKIDTPVDVDGNGSLEAFAKDETLYVNRPSGDQALVIDRRGTPQGLGKSAGGVAGNKEPPATTPITEVLPRVNPRDPGRPGRPGQTPTPGGGGDTSGEPTTSPTTTSPTTTSPTSPTTTSPTTTSPTTTSPTTTTGPSIPTAPSGGSVTLSGTSALRVTWSDNSNNEDGFGITSVDGPLNLGANTTSHTLTGYGSWSGEICIYVWAFNELGQSSVHKAGCHTFSPAETTTSTTTTTTTP